MSTIIMKAIPSTYCNSNLFLDFNSIRGILIIANKQRVSRLVFSLFITQAKFFNSYFLITFNFYFQLLFPNSLLTQFPSKFASLVIELNHPQSTREFVDMFSGLDIIRTLIRRFASSADLIFYLRVC